MSEITLGKDNHKAGLSTLVDFNHDDNTIPQGAVLAREDGTTVVVVKKKSPILSIFLTTVMVVSIVFFALILIGFVMGLSGNRPPSMEWGIVSNQWNKVTNNTTTDSLSELDKKNPEGTINP